MSEAEPMSREGELLGGKYRLLGKLGEGGMGDVYRAVNVIIDRPVAIKVLRAEHAKKPEIAARFLREAKAANLVRHENVVDVLDMGHDDNGAPYIVQELLQGRDLSTLVEGALTGMSVARVLEIMLPVLDAVGFAHGKGVVHRDLKPGNIFLSDQYGRVVPKLLDFGISQVVSAEPRVTAVGSMMGTPRYMSPEQVQAAPNLDARADVWAVGVILYEMLSGAPPFQAETVPAVLVKICTEDPVPLEARVPGLPEGLVKVVRRCLRRPLAERYPSAVEIAADLRRVPTAAAPSQVETLDPGGLPGAAPTLAAVAANAFQAELDFPARSKRPEPPAAPPASKKPPAAGASGASASKPAPSSSKPPVSGPQPAVSQRPPVLIDEPAHRPLELAVPRPLPSRRPIPAYVPPSEPKDASVNEGAGWLGRIVFRVLLVAVAVRALLFVLPHGLPVVSALGEVLHPLPDGTFGVFGLALGVGAVSVAVAALRQRPIWWGLVVLGAGFAVLSYCAVLLALDLDFGGKPRDLLPLGAVLVPAGLGVLGLQRLLSRKASDGGVPGALLLSAGGLFFALTLARPEPPAPPAPSDTPGGTPQTADSSGAVAPAIDAAAPASATLSSIDASSPRQGASAPSSRHAAPASRSSR